MALFYTEQETPCCLLAPASGEVVSIYDLPDILFSSGTLGEGFAVIPEEEIVCAPIDGIITQICDTLNGYTLLTDSGAEIAIFVGLGGEVLLGDGYRALVLPNQRVSVGTPICAFDPEILKAGGITTTTAVILKNPDSFRELTVFEGDCRISQSVVMSFTGV